MLNELDPQVKALLEQFQANAARHPAPATPLSAKEKIIALRQMMGASAASSVTDAYGRVHGLDNVYVADGSVFVTSGAHNPTNTIMAVALRNMRHLAGSP